MTTTSILFVVAAASTHATRQKNFDAGSVIALLAALVMFACDAPPRGGDKSKELIFDRWQTDRRLEFRVQRAMILDDTLRIHSLFVNRDTVQWIVLKPQVWRGTINHLWAVYIAGCDGTLELSWPNEDGSIGVTKLAGFELTEENYIWLQTHDSASVVVSFPIDEIKLGGHTIRDCDDSLRFALFCGNVPYGAESDSSIFKGTLLSQWARIERD